MCIRDRSSPSAASSSTRTSSTARWTRPATWPSSPCGSISNPRRPRLRVATERSGRTKRTQRPPHDIGTLDCLGTVGRVPMTVTPSADGRRLRPVVALLAAHWESKTEEGWITRQVAGALAWVADVHVITPEGSTAGTSTDSVFTLHRMATPIEPAAELRRDLLIEGLSETGACGDVPGSPELSSLLDQGLVGPWGDASDILSALQPDLAVIAGHQDVGALNAVDRHEPGLPVTLLALGADADSIAFPHFASVFARADTVLAVTESERLTIVEHHGRPDAVRRIGAPLSANPSALSEPNGWVGDTGYLLVLGVDAGEDEEVAGVSHPAVGLTEGAGVGAQWCPDPTGRVRAPMVFDDGQALRLGHRQHRVCTGEHRGDMRE